MKMSGRQTLIGAKAADGRRPVMWWIDGAWVHKGWLMPEVTHG